MSNTFRIFKYEQTKYVDNTYQITVTVTLRAEYAYQYRGTAVRTVIIFLSLVNSALRAA